jgi:uncharacterized phage protein (TIGR01671 family)
MRQIKFRAWYPKEKVWLDGVEVYHDGSWMGEIIRPDHADIGYCEKDGCILEQFTGLLDKNGKEIYEGDILRTHEYYGGDYLTPIATIIVSYEICASGSAGFYLPDEVYWNRCEIIGNIHENPELLK